MAVMVRSVGSQSFNCAKYIYCPSRPIRKFRMAERRLSSYAIPENKTLRIWYVDVYVHLMSFGDDSATATCLQRMRTAKTGGTATFSNDSSEKSREPQKLRTLRVQPTQDASRKHRL